MTLTIHHALVAIALGTIMSSCVPVDEHGRPLRRQPDPTKPQPTQQQTANQKITDPKQKEIDAKREEMRKKEAARKREADRRKAENEVERPTPPKNDEDDMTTTPPVEKPAPQPKANHPVAAAVPGKPGFVFSPFNNKVVDVKGIASGTLVMDPQYPPSEKKHFRVP